MPSVAPRPSRRMTRTGNSNRTELVLGHVGVVARSVILFRLIYEHFDAHRY